MHLQQPEIERDLYSLESIAAEIIAFTGQGEAMVWRRLALELAETGSNVIAECKRFGVTPFVFDDAMLRFYKESDGFIYETLIESRNPFRVEKWRSIAAFLDQDSTLPRAETRVLLYGDSVGSDSIYLKQLGYEVVYHDFDSYCAAFAKFRFDKRGLSIPKFSEDPSRTFDYVICLEVAEHVPSPPELVRELRGYTKDPDGVCVFSESFKLLLPTFPTHLQTNLQYRGKSDELFKNVGMVPLWKDSSEKPLVYVLNPTRPHVHPHSETPSPALWQRAGARLARALRPA